MNVETAIRNKAIAACADIAFLWPYQVGKFYTLDARLITIGVPGFPDTIGFRKFDGKFIVIEFKTQDKQSKLRPDQEAFRDNIGKKFPIIWGVARSVEDARKIILEE